MSETVLPLARPQTRIPASLLLVGVAAVELVVFIIGLALGARGWDVLVLLLALLTSFLAAGPIVFDMSRPADRRQLMITLLTFVYSVYLVVPVFTRYFLMKGVPVRGLFNLSEAHPADIAHAQLVALLGLLSLLLGFYSPFGRIAVSPIPKPTRDWTPRATLTIAVVTIGLGWLVYLPGQLGLIPSWAGSGALGSVATGSYFGLALLTLAWLRHRSRSAVLLLMLIVPLSMALNFFTGSKRAVLTPPFMIALAYVVYERRIRKKWLVGGLAMLIVLYPFAQFYREIAQTTRTSGMRTFFQHPAAIMESLSQFGKSANLSDYLSTGLQSTGKRLDSLGVLEVIVKDTPERVPYQGGWTIGLIFLSYVPRIVWPNKPGLTIGTWVMQHYGSALDLQTNLGPTWIGELFFNWGYLGVAGGMLLLGILFRTFQERLFGWQASVPALFAAVVVLYGCCRSVEGALLSPVNTVTFYAGPILVAHLVVGFFGGYQPLRARDTGMPRAAAGSSHASL